MKTAIKHNDKIVTENSKLVHLFSNHDINIAESISGMSSESTGNPKCKSDYHLTVSKIIRYFKNHRNIKTINKIYTKKDIFDIPTATTEEINQIIKNLHPKKVTGLKRFHQKL